MIARGRLDAIEDIRGDLEVVHRDLAEQPAFNSWLLCRTDNRSIAPANANNRRFECINSCDTIETQTIHNTVESWEKKKLYKEWRSKSFEERNVTIRKPEIKGEFVLMIGPGYCGLVESEIRPKVLVSFFGPKVVRVIRLGTYQSDLTLEASISMQQTSVKSTWTFSLSTRWPQRGNPYGALPYTRRKWDL